MGPIRPGMTESEVKEVLGPPSIWSNGKVHLMAYGALQLAFVHHSGAAEGELEEIGLRFIPECAASIEAPPPPVWPLEDFDALSARTTFDDFRKFLDRVGLSKDADADSQVREEEMQVLFIPPASWITFHGDRLFSIHFFDSAPPKKQISLSVSEDTLNQLKKLARQSKKSVSAICAEWIAQRANELQYAPEGVGSRE